MLGRLPHPRAQAGLLECSAQLLFDGLVGACPQLGLTVHGRRVPVPWDPGAQLWNRVRGAVSPPGAAWPVGAMVGAPAARWPVRGPDIHYRVIGGT